MVTFLLVVSVNNIYFEKYSAHSNDNKTSLNLRIKKAVMEGNKDLVVKLLRQGADPNTLIDRDKKEPCFILPLTILMIIWFWHCWTEAPITIWKITTDQLLLILFSIKIINQKWLKELWGFLEYGFIRTIRAIG